MFRRYKFLTSFCVIFATLCGGAYGAASTRAGTTGRAGSLRTLGGGTSASVKATTSNTSSVAVAPESSESVDTGRMAHLSGIGGGKLTGKINLPAAASSQALNELRQAIQQLRNDYDALGNQYSNLSSDVSNVSDTAQNARVAAANNTSTLTVVRSDLNDAKSDIEDLKTNGAFDAARVQQEVETALAGKNYATQSDLATTDAVARGAVQTNELPQKLTALNVADKDYVDAKVATGLDADQVLDIVGNSYYSKDQTNSVISDATRNLVDKGYVNTQVGNMLNGYATQDYVDMAVATGMDEDQVRGIVGGVVNDTMGNYYSKNETDTAIYNATKNFVGKGYVDNAVNGLVSEDTLAEALEDIVDEDYVQTIVSGSLQNLNYADKGYVDTQIQNGLNGLVTEDDLAEALDGIEVGVNAGDVQNIVNNYLENSNYIEQSYVDNALNGLVSEDRLAEALEGIDTGLNEDDVQTIVNSSLSNLNYADKGWVSDQISVGINGLASYDYVDESLEGYLKGTDAEDTYLKKVDAATTYAPIGLQNKFGTMDSKETVTAYVEDKLDDYATKEYVNENTPNIQIEQDTSTGDWYICKISDCTGQPFTNESAWNKFNANVDLTGYLTEDDADVKYAGKSVQTAVEDSTTGLAAAHTKIGTLPAGYSNVVGYVDQKVSEVSPEIQIEQEDGNTYICKTGNNCHTPVSSYPDEWSQITVSMEGYLTQDDADELYASIDLGTTVAGHTTSIGNLGTAIDNDSTSNPGLKQRVDTLESTIDDTSTGLAAAHNKAQSALDKIGNLPAGVTAKGYVDNKVGTLPDGYSNVVGYVDQKVSEVSPEIQVKTVDGTTYICPTNDCEEDPPSEGWEELTVNLSGYLQTGTADSTYLKKTGISLSRNGDKIQLSGGGIQTAYDVANLTDLMCQSYRIDTKAVREDEIEYELVCITATTEGQ